MAKRKGDSAACTKHLPTLTEIQLRETVHHRQTLKTDLRKLLKINANHFIDDLRNPSLKWALYRLRHMVSLMESAIPHE